MVQFVDIRELVHMMVSIAHENVLVYVFVEGIAQAWICFRIPIRLLSCSEKAAPALIKLYISSLRIDNQIVEVTETLIRATPG